MMEVSSGARRGLTALALMVAIVVVGLGLMLRGSKAPSEARFVQTSEPRQVSRPGGAPREAPAKQVAIGERIPSLALPNLEGVMTSLGTWKGKVLVLNVWASWCPPCVAEMPSLQALHEKGLEGVAVVGISVDDSRTTARALATKTGIMFPVLFDVGGERIAAWGTVMFPETWIIAPDGTVLARVIGESDWASPEVVQRLEAWAKTSP